MPEKFVSHQRKIIHIDMDCFYAAVEVRENPQLKNKPVAVGGLPGQRGVVAACNYEARAFGVHSAMPMSRAFRQCPQLVRLPVRMDLYKQVSMQIRTIFSEYTELIEPLSLDEAYLDVSGKTFCRGSASLMAKEIRQRIFNATGLTASAGVAPNKLLAKIASDWNKPNGQAVIPPAQVDEFIRPLPVSKIFGVGKVTADKMNKLGWHTCEDLQRQPQELLRQQFGIFGERLYHLCRGRDDRPVNNDRITKSISIEDTYSIDLANLAACQAQLQALFDGLMRRYTQARLKARHKAKERGRAPQQLQAKTIFLKMRFTDFVTTTAQQAGTEPDMEAYRELCERAYARGEKPVRLLGLGIMFKSNSKQAATGQRESGLVE